MSDAKVNRKISQRQTKSIANILMQSRCNQCAIHRPFRITKNPYLSIKYGSYIIINNVWVIQ